MLTPTEIDHAIHGLARRTLGVFHARDLLRSGLTSRHVRTRVRRGTAVELLPRTFLDAPIGTDVSFDQECMAGVLAGGDGSRIDGIAAASLRGWWNRRVDHIDVSLPDRHRRSAPTRWRFHRSTCGLWLPGQPVTIGPVPVADVLQMLVTAANHVTEYQLAFIISEAIRDGAVQLAELERQVAACRGWRGIATVRAALALVQDGSWGTRCFTEDCYVSEFGHVDLPMPRVNERGAVGLARDEPDFVWEAFRANVESDGRHHELPSQREDDRRRDADAMALGWRVLRVRARDFHRRRRQVMAAVVAFVHGAEMPVHPGTRILQVR